jgi:tetratricopeptide (TPR) repeat protein
MTGVLIAAAVIAIPALAFVVWPLVRRDPSAVFLAFPLDPREQLTEQKRGIIRVLRELEFEHAAGHVSDDDYADLRARYEADAADILAALDRLEPAPPPPPARDAAAAPPARPSAWLHPGALGAAAVFLVVFGIALGVGIVRYTAPDEPEGMGMRGMGASPGAGGGGTMGGAAVPGPVGDSSTAEGGDAERLPPGTMQGMLDAARASLFAGRYADALAAYQAILTREPDNASALAHVGLMAAMANHPDKALELIDRALAIDPTLPPALLFRGQVLRDAKGDLAGAIEAWERYLEVAPAGEDRAQVEQFLANAKSRGPGR